MLIRTLKTWKKRWSGWNLGPGERNIRRKPLPRRTRLLLEWLEDRTVPSALVWTDQLDYAPGSVATINASGFEVGEAIQLQVVRIDGIANISPANDPWTVIDGSAEDLDSSPGNIQTTWYVDPYFNGATLQVTATGAHDSASAIFTDAVGIPTLQSVVGVSPSQIDVTWTVPNSALDSIQIQRKLSGDPDTTYALIANVTATGPNTSQSYSDTSGLSANTSYTYRLIGVKVLGTGETQYSDPSNALAATTPPPDNIEPTTTATLTNADATSYTPGTWTNQNVTVALSAADNVGGTGVDHITYSASGAQTIAETTYATSFTISAEGTTTVTYWAVDNAGNIEADHTVTIMIDKTAPTISTSSDGQAWADLHGGWNNTDVTVSYTVGDTGGSGINTGPPSDYAADLLSASGTASGTVYDVAGNSATASYTANIDKEAPTLTATIDKLAAATGWYNIATGAPTITYTAADALSGGVTSPAAVTLGPGADQDLRRTVTDTAGNSTTVTFATFTGDGTTSVGLADIDVDLAAPVLNPIIVDPSTINRQLPSNLSYQQEIVFSDSDFHDLDFYDFYVVVDFAGKGFGAGSDIQIYHVHSDTPGLQHYVITGTAPAEGGPHKIQVKVSDGNNESVVKNFYVQVFLANQTVDNVQVVTVDDSGTASVGTQDDTINTAAQATIVDAPAQTQVLLGTYQDPAAVVGGQDVFQIGDDPNNLNQAQAAFEARVSGLPDTSPDTYMELTFTLNLDVAFVLSHLGDITPDPDNLGGFRQEVTNVFITYFDADGVPHQVVTRTGFPKAYTALDGDQHLIVNGGQVTVALTAILWNDGTTTPKLSDLHGTVFTVAVAMPPTPTSAPVTPPLATAALDTAALASASTTLTATFAGGQQPALILRVSTTTELSSSRTEAGARSDTGGGGAEDSDPLADLNINWLLRALGALDSNDNPILPASGEAEPGRPMRPRNPEQDQPEESSQTSRWDALEALFAKASSADQDFAPVFGNLGFTPVIVDTAENTRVSAGWALFAAALGAGGLQVARPEQAGKRKYLPR